MAIKIARLDVTRAYEGDYLIPIDVPKPVANILPYPFYKKRRGSGRVTLDDIHGARQ